MIKSFAHKGLERFFKAGSKSGIRPDHAAKLARQLAILNVASKPEQMDIPGWGLHPLKGDLADHWAVWVNANWRMTFRFVGEDAEIVDYQDYH
ncbi:type II toxin-antitoxin system RelE/ParE family toxin [Paraburkholderia sp. RL17-381-BIF-C]|uniref:type II toxin-antitoxin system RelE/ParE family toxin n=1 Tax=Paraburkholderia sp. RL17-381-BIF-C TaxID=3031635 RepID=UPI0038BC4D35